MLLLFPASSRYIKRSLKVVRISRLIRQGEGSFSEIQKPAWYAPEYEKTTLEILQELPLEKKAHLFACGKSTAREGVRLLPWAAEGSKLLEVGASEYMIYFYGQKREELCFAWSVRITQLIMRVGYTVLCNLTEVSL